MTRPRRPRASLAARVLAAALLGAGALVAMAPPAHAHALLERSVPAGDSIVDHAPSEVLITFTEPPDPDLSQIGVLDSTGSTVAQGPAAVPPGDEHELRVPLRPGLLDGVYTVTWRTTSTADGHSTGGSFAFGVGVSPAGSAPPAGAVIPATPKPSPEAVAGRWLLYAGLAVLLATATMRFAVLREPPRGSRIVLPAAWTLAAAGLLLVALAESSAAGVSLGTLLSSATGTPLARQATALGLTGVAVAIASIRRSDAAIAAVGLGAAAGLLFHAIGGHAGAPGALRGFDVLVQWLHLLAVGIWIGGLAWLLIDLRDAAGVRRNAHIRRFSGLAAPALAVVLATGTIRSVDLLGGWTVLGRLLTTGWGNALLWKLGLFAGLVALAAWNRFVNVRRLDDAHAFSVRRLLGGELLLAASIFAVTGVLAGLPPPGQLAAMHHPAQSRVVVSGSDFATTTRVRLEITPGTVGENRFDAEVSDYDTREPVAATRVALRFDLPAQPGLGASTLELRREGPGSWTTTSTALSIEGTWDVVVLVQTDRGATEVPLVVRARPPTPAATPTGSRTSVARTPGLPDLYTITLPGGSSVQAYLDPARPGRAEVHFTAFDSNGSELPLKSAEATATSSSGTRPLKLLRLSPGHFTANVRLTAGTWSFGFDSTAKTGAAVSASFEQEVT
jgi:copper transport protein